MSDLPLWDEWPKTRLSSPLVGEGWGCRGSCCIRTIPLNYLLALCRRPLLAATPPWPRDAHGRSRRRPATPAQLVAADANVATHLHRRRQAAVHAGRRPGPLGHCRRAGPGADRSCWPTAACWRPTSPAATRNSLTGRVRSARHAEDCRWNRSPASSSIRRPAGRTATACWTASPAAAATPTASCWTTATKLTGLVDRHRRRHPADRRPTPGRSRSRPAAIVAVLFRPCGEEAGRQQGLAGVGRPERRQPAAGHASCHRRRLAAN